MCSNVDLSSQFLEFLPDMYIHLLWHASKYSTILILVLCLLCVMPLVCSSYSSFGPPSPFFRDDVEPA